MIRFKERVVPLALLAVSIFIYMTYILPTLLGTSTALTAVTSNSMKPTLEQGDLAVIAGYNGFEEIGENDIIVYSFENWGFIVHRVVKINPDEKTVRTRGDANSQVDQWEVNYRDIRGRVVFKIPYIGYVVMTGKSMLSDLEDLGMPSPVIGGTLTGIAVILFLSGMDSPPWDKRSSDSFEKEYVKEVKKFLSSDRQKSKIDDDFSSSKIFTQLKKSIKNIGKDEYLTVVRCDDDVYLVRREALESSDFSPIIE